MQFIGVSNCESKETAKVKALSSQLAFAAHAETVGTLLGTVCAELWIS